MIVRCLVITCVLGSGAIAAPPAAPVSRDPHAWESLLRDPAASVRWVDARTLRLFPVGEGLQATEIDVATGRTRTIDPSEVPDRALAAGPLRSRGQGRSAGITFVNRTPGVVRLAWIDARGREHGYGELRAGAERFQQTYAGHAWRVTAADGTVLGFVAGEELPIRAVVTGRADAPAAAVGDAAGAPAAPPEAPAAPPTPPAEPALPAAAQSFAGPALWSPDRAHVVVWDVTPAQKHPVTLIESAPKDQVQPKVRIIDYLKPGDRIEQRWPRLFAADGTERPLERALFANPWSIDECRWSADGRTFFFRCNQRGHQVLRLCALDAATGAVRGVVADESPTFVDYAAKGWMHWISDRELLWMSERDGWNHVYRVDVASGALAPVTTGPWMVREVEDVDAAARTLRLRVMGIDPAQDPYHVHVVRVPLDGGPPVRLTQGDGTHRLAWSPDGAHYVDTWSRVDQPPVHELRRASDGALVRELGRADVSAMVAAGWTPPERVVAKGRDGTTDVWGVVWRPCGSASDAAPRPVVEQIYAGPHDFFVPKEWSAWHGQRDLTREGCVVVQVDGMGTNWRGKRFHDVCWKNLKDAGLPDHVAWLRAAAATRPWMDLSRVGIYGGSAGGQNAMRALLDFPAVYKVGVADCGCHDNRMDKIWWNELWMGWPVDESYARSSNVVDAAKLQGRLMLIVGELDDNVDPASTMQVAAALQRAGKDFELVVVAGTGHGAAETAYGSRRRREFLLRHLRDQDAGR